MEVHVELIGDVAVTKRHLHFFFFYTHVQEISKVVYKKTLSGICSMKPEHNKRMMIAEDCAKFYGCIAWQSFLVNNFADFPDVVRVKKLRFRSVIGGSV